MCTQAHLTPRAIQMFAIIEKYQAGVLRQKAFCRQEKLKYPTFQYWLKKYRQAQAKPQKPQPSSTNQFIPLTITQPWQPTTASQQVVIEFPNGVVIRLYAQVKPEFLLKLLQSGGG